MLLAVFLALSAGCATRKAAEEEISDVLPEDELAKIQTARFIDNRPYEFTWHNPLEEHDPLVDFSGLEGWRVVAPRGLKARFERTFEKQLWGKYTGLFRCGRGEDESRFLIRPPLPIPIPEDFDSVSLWIYRPPEDAASWATSRVDVVLRDARGLERVVPLAALDWPQGWFLVQRSLDGDALKGMRFPYEFAGLAVTCAGGREPLQIYFDSLAFFLASRRPVGPPAGEPSFAADASVLPRTDAAGIVHRIGLAGPGVYQLFCGDRGFETEYRFDAAKGLSGLSLWRHGREAGRLMAGAAVRGLPADSRVRLHRQEGSEVYVEYDSGLSLRLGLAGRSLVIEARCPGGAAEELSTGHLEGFDRVDMLRLPFLSTGMPASPAVAMISSTRRGGRRVSFLSIWLDWYRSAASEMMPPARMDSPSGGAVYRPRTEGRRNDLLERIVITASGRLEEVLPEVPHTPAAKMDALAGRILMRVPGAADYREAGQYFQTLCRYGLTNLILASDRAIWTDGWGSTGLRTKANPHRGGDEALKMHAATLQDAGAVFGLYAHCTSLSPLNGNWSSEAACTDASGNWLRMDASSYVLKPSAAGVAAAAVREAVSKFGARAVVAEGIADDPPWMREDYDARAAGAGKFSGAYSALAGLLKSLPVPVVAGDGTSPLYAGFADAFITGERAWNREEGDSYLPVFKLMKLQPLSLWYGPELSLSMDAPPDSRRADEGMATWLAYGQLGELPFGWQDPARVARIYWMMQALQPFYAGKTPQRVAWWDGQRLLNVSEAFTAGVVENSQMYFLYPGGFELWVNGSLRKSWNVKVGETEWTLPPNGWLAVAPDFLAASVMADGKRLDFVRGRDFAFYDGRGRADPFEGFLSPANILIRRTAALNQPDAVEVFDTSGGKEIGISAEWLNHASQVACRVQNEDATWSEVPVRKERGMYLFKGPSHGARYVLWPVL